MNIYRSIRGGYYKVCGAFGYVGMAAMFFITCVMTIDVILRLISSIIPSLNLYILGTYEMTEMVMVVIIAFGYAVTQRDKGHVRVTIITDRLPRRFREFFDGVVCAITTAVCVITTYCAFRQGTSFLEDKITTTTLFIPYFPFAYVLGLGFALFAVMLFFDTIDHFVAAFKKEKRS